MKINNKNHHEIEKFNKNPINGKHIEVNIPENTVNFKKINKNVDISDKVTPINGANLNYNA